MLKEETQHTTQTSSGDYVMSIRNLYKGFGSNKVLNDFNLNIPKGKSIGVLGKSGSGKSVLIKCIIGLMPPDSGSINVLGQEVPKLNNEDLDKLRVKVGFLFQSNALYDSMTVRENLEFPLRRHWMKKETRNVNDLVMEALEAVGLGHTVDMMPSELSGGMRKGIAIARTLIFETGNYFVRRTNYRFRSDYRKRNQSFNGGSAKEIQYNFYHYFTRLKLRKNRGG